MHKQTFTYSHSQIIGSITSDPSRVQGRGMGIAPAIHVPVDLEMMALGSARTKQVGVLFDRVSGSMSFGHAGGFAVGLTPHSVRRIIMQGSVNQHLDLQFRIEPYQIEAIERSRNSEDVSLTLHLNVEFMVLVQEEQNGSNVGVIPPRAVIDVGNAPVSMSFKVPRSVWTSEVLSQVGYGQILLFELPAFPVSAIATLGEAFEAAKRAQSQFNAGEYDLCVGLCRTAIQPLRNHLKKIKETSGNDTSADWAEKVGEATFNWLTAIAGKTHGMGSAALHEGSPGRFSRLDAQMILTTTVSIVAYAARLEKAYQ